MTEITLNDEVIEMLKYVIDNHEWCKLPVAEDEHSCICGRGTDKYDCYYDGKCADCKMENKAHQLLIDLKETEENG